MTRPGTWTLRCDASVISVLPERGAIVSQVTVGGVDLLYLEDATLDSPSGAVRGGIPLLFPFAGELQDGRLVSTGTTLPRHGFARRKAWTAALVTDDSISMDLSLDEEIRTQYPFAFEVRQVVTAVSNGVRLDLHVENRDTRPLPLAPGWHPYFPCPSRRKRECLALVLPRGDLPPSEPLECDLNVPAPPSGRIDISLPDIGIVSMTYSAKLETLEVWTLPGKDFVCIEPWCGPSNLINTPRRVTIAPGEHVVFSMGIELGS
jgi:galactose mutarotase-like enzyme